MKASRRVAPDRSSSRADRVLLDGLPKAGANGSRFLWIGRRVFHSHGDFAESAVARRPKPEPEYAGALRGLAKGARSGPCPALNLRFLLMKARVTVTLKSGILDPQGKAIEGALKSLGIAGVASVRQGKVFDIELEGSDRAKAEAALKAAADKLLANTVIENYRIEVL